MSKKIIQVSHEEVIRYCDECKSLAHWQCSMCFKDLCHEHIRDHPLDDMGDHPPRLCESCLKKGMPFIKEIKKLQLEQDNQRDLWEKECENVKGS